MLQVQSPLQQFFGLSGDPLDDGSIYIGTAGQNPETNPIAVFWDEDGTLPAVQPLKTSNGYLVRSGTPARVYVGTADYSMTARDRKGRVVFNTANVTALSNLEADLASPEGSSLVGFSHSASPVGGDGTVDKKLRTIVCATDAPFNVRGDGSNQFTEIDALWQYCLANGYDIFFPDGEFSSGVNNMPFKHPNYPATDLLDCKNITIYGNGPNTVLRSDSVTGADVLNLYSVKNLHFKNMRVKASLSGFAGAGSNGCSIVGGFDNLTFDKMWFEDLPYVDKALYLDGGKAFTIQPGTPATECGTVKATNIFAKGCVYGVGLEVDLVNWGSKKHSIDVDIVAEDCYHGVLFSAGEATGPLSVGMTMGYRVRAQLINCQRSVAISRAHGCDIDAQIITTKTAAQKRLNPQGGAWNSIDAVVDALISTYAKDSRVAVYGAAGEVDYKVQIGGAGAGLSGQGGSTDNCQFYIDLGGQANTAIFNLVDSGGNTTTNCAFYISTTTGVTLASLPVLLFAPAENNTVTVGPAQRLVNITLQDGLKFAHTDGVTSYNDLTRDELGLFFRQTGGSSADLQVMGVKNHVGAKKFAVRNDGYICSDGRASATAVATVKGVLPIYDTANVLVGYVPIYTTYTP